jgi:hypothetical protein
LRKFLLLFGPKCIVTLPAFAWLIGRGSNFMIDFIGPLYNCLQQFTNHYLTHCHLLPTGESTGTILTSNWTPFYSIKSPTVPTYNSLERNLRKTLFSVVKSACLLVRYLAMDVLFLRAQLQGCVYQAVA